MEELSSTSYCILYIVSNTNHTPHVPLTGRLMFTVTLSLGDRGYTREVWTWSCDMEVGGSVLN